MSDVTYVRLDVIPALLTTDGESLYSGTLRVVVTTDTLYAYADGPTGPVTVLEERIDAISGRNTTGWTVTLADGSTAHVKRAGGCACGSQLRSFRPFQGSIVQLAMPQA